MPAPRLYAWKRPLGWSLRNPRYVLFQVREVGGIAAAVFALLLLWQLRRFRMGEAAYDAFSAMLAEPPVFVASLVLLALVLVHALTWFMLIGKAQPVAFTQKPIPWQRAFGINIVLWILVSGAVLFLFFGGL